MLNPKLAHILVLVVCTSSRHQHNSYYFEEIFELLRKTKDLFISILFKFTAVVSKYFVSKYCFSNIDYSVHYRDQKN